MNLAETNHSLHSPLEFFIVVLLKGLRRSLIIKGSHLEDNNGVVVVSGLCDTPSQCCDSL